MLRTLFLSLLLIASASPAVAREKLTRETVTNIVGEASRIITKNYVHPHKAKTINTRLAQSLASGRYAVSNPQRLAELMTEDLRAVSNDTHMYIKFDPIEARAQKASRPDNIRPFSALIPATNNGITELKVLGGNVRYINIILWLWDQKRSPRVYDDAMRFLRGGDAYIVDLRDNIGGEADAADYFISHFLEPGTKLAIFRSGPIEVEESFSTKIGGEQLPHRPLFLLVGADSASASEATAMHVRNFNLGKLVGANTAGGGNSNDMFPIDPGFLLSVSTDTVVHAVTNTGWEGTGVPPDIAVPPSAALDRAHLEALKVLQQTAAPGKEGQYAWHARALEAKLNPPTLSAAHVRGLPGRYEGPRTVSERGGKLFYKRGDGLERELIPLAGDLFGLGEHTSSTRLRFNRTNGVVTGASFVTARGPSEDIARLGD